jgi:hypothetical protein
MQIACTELEIYGNENFPASSRRSFEGKAKIFKTYFPESRTFLRQVGSADGSIILNQFWVAAKRSSFVIKAKVNLVNEGSFEEY